MTDCCNDLGYRCVAADGGGHTCSTTCGTAGSFCATTQDCCHGTQCNPPSDGGASQCQPLPCVDAGSCVSVYGCCGNAYCGLGDGGYQCLPCEAGSCIGACTVAEGTNCFHPYNCCPSAGLQCDHTNGTVGGFCKYTGLVCSSAGYRCDTGKDCCSGTCGLGSDGIDVCQ
jgi:hypothetical protein